MIVSLPCLPIPVTVESEDDEVVDGVDKDIHRVIWIGTLVVWYSVCFT